MVELEIDDNTILKRNDELYLTSLLGDELILMNLEDGNYVSMNEVGTIIWKILEHPLSFKELIDQLVKGSGVENNQCRTETMNFLTGVLQHKMILIE